MILTVVTYATLIIVVVDIAVYVIVLFIPLMAEIVVFLSLFGGLNCCLFCNILQKSSCKFCISLNLTLSSQFGGSLKDL